MTPSFDAPARHGFLRVAAGAPQAHPADPRANAAEILALARRAAEAGAAILVCPELSLSGYAIDDLLLQDALLARVDSELARLAEMAGRLPLTLFVGAPLVFEGRLYNCAVALQAGGVLGVTPKSHLPNYREFYERRWFTPGLDVAGAEITVAGAPAPFGTDLLFDSPAAVVHVEICEDLWVASPPSGAAAQAGAEILVNLSASNVTLGKARRRTLLCASQSLRCEAAYVYAAAGPGESTTDLAWDGQAAIFELGETLAETERFAATAQMCVADVDVGRLRAERLRTRHDPPARSRPWRRLALSAGAAAQSPRALVRPNPRFPFVPGDPARLASDCREAWAIQVQGLAQRLKAARLDRLVIGVSGGLDSTQALIVAVKAAQACGLPATKVLAYTLPGPATSAETRAAAWDLMEALGVTAAEIDIGPAAQLMLADLGHPAARGEPVYDVTYENVQAGLRTDYLFRLANHNRALVVGTGDLSELALGWQTYGVGDQMSHYNPNAGVPKTLIQHMIRFAAHSGDFTPRASAVMQGVLAREISPELVPVQAGGDGPQSTQAVVGPYALHDFFLFHHTRFGFAPSKIAYLAWCAWGDARAGVWPHDLPETERRAYDLPEIVRWLEVFLRRFFANQFKRSAMPNGPKLTSGGSLSPRGDWRMPSDAVPDAWLDELAANVDLSLSRRDH